MLISKQWLQEFVDLSDITAEDLARELTLRVAEVEDMFDVSESLANVVVGEIVKIIDHPNADTLKVCSVNTGKKDVQVVCGGSNIAVGMKVAMGLVGAKVLWHGEGDLVELKETSIRGEKSFGMICAAEEIGLGELFPKKDTKEILDISHVDAAPGTPLADALGMNDVVFDIDNKTLTHRPDLWGHYGIARETSAIFDKKFVPMDPSGFKNKNERKVSVDIKATDGCHRFMGVIVEGVTVEPSPDWMQQRLQAVGVRPINNVVDITNYVMYELGQPTHAYDADKLVTDKKGDISLTIRHAKKDEPFTTLDGQNHTLTKDMFVIADDKKPVLLGGIMGGENSAVDEKTTSILFESANFDATVVRKTSQVLGLRTDGSARWEKSQDPIHAEIGLRRLVELITQLCPDARVVSNIVDEGTYSIDQGPLELTHDFITKKIGIEIPQKKCVSILTSLGFEVKEKKGTLIVTIPTWRATKDISVIEDLVEEIVRLHGYENVPATFPTFSITPPTQEPLRLLSRELKDFVAYEAGYTEVHSYSFVSPELLTRLGITDHSAYIELDNPIAKDRPFLRRSLLPNMLQQLEHNLHRYNTVKLFEIGKIFLQEEVGDADGNDGVLPKQDTLMSMVYAAKGEDTPFYEVSTRFAELMARVGVALEYRKTNLSHTFVHPGRVAEVVVSGTVIGFIAELHPMVCEKLGVDYRAAILEVNLNTLLPFVTESSSYQSLSQYPSVQRDIAFLVDSEVKHDDIASFLIESDLLTVDVELFDVYQGTHSAIAQGKISEGKKSMAYRITYRSDDKTLESGEVDEVHGRIVEALKKEFSAEVR